MKFHFYCVPSCSCSTRIQDFSSFAAAPASLPILIYNEKEQEGQSDREIERGREKEQRLLGLKFIIQRWKFCHSSTPKPLFHRFSHPEPPMWSLKENSEGSRFDPNGCSVSPHWLFLSFSLSLSPSLGLFLSHANIARSCSSITILLVVYTHEALGVVAIRCHRISYRTALNFSTILLQ